MGKYFGTDGFRGHANTSLNSKHAFLIGSYFGQAAVKYSGYDKAKIVIGKDTRISGDMFVNALSAGIVSTGASAYILGTIPTPGVAYITNKFNFNFGIMISASHNPYYDNGIKVLNMHGEKLTDKVIGLCEDYIDAGIDNVVLAKDEYIGTCCSFNSAHKSYIDHIKNAVKNKFNGVNIALDCANGAASGFAYELFNSLGANVSIINDKPNGVNINVDCGSTHLKCLSEYVKSKNFDIGFAFDGDADRCLAVDSNGAEISGDQLMLICARRLKQENRLKNNTLVTTVMSNFGLYKALDKFDISYEKTNVGDRFVYENMIENNHKLGGEQSGHIIFSDYATTGDGMLTAVSVVDSLIELNEDISQASSKMRVYPQVLKNITVDDKQTSLKDSRVLDSISKVEKALDDNGRILVRPSGTEPLIRIMVEAGDVDTCHKMVDSVINSFDLSGHIV